MPNIIDNIDINSIDNLENILDYTYHNAKNVNKITYPIVGVLAIFTLLYHSVHLIYNSH